MKKPLTVALILFAARWLHAATTVTSSISSATVYADRAVITRTAEIDAVPGEQQYVFQHLPAGLLADSIQVSGGGSAQVTILEVTTNQDYLSSNANESSGKLESEVKDLQQQRRAVTDRSTTLDQQQALLTQIANWGASIKPGERDAPATPQMNPAAWQQLIDFYTAGLEKIAAERRSLDLRRDDIDGRISALDAKLGESQSAVGRVVENVTVHASVGRAGRLTLTLSYAVLNASWRPTYDARLSSSDKTLSLGYFGVVRQNTGEDWKAVALTLSTARPSVGGATPSLQPWILAQREQAPRGRDGLNLSPFVVEADKDTGYAATSTLAGTRIQSNLKDVGGSISAVTGKFLRDSDSANSQDLLVATGYPEVGGQALYQQAAMDNRATSATFRIPGLTDVPSDNVPHKVGVTTVTLKADLAYQSVPKLLPAAFLGAAAKNDSGYPLLAGRMSSFLDGTFVANGGLTTTMPGEKLNLPFGVDDGIKVERKLVNRFTEDIGLVTSQVRVTYDAVITVTNNKSSTASVTVKDQVPISRHEKIKVEQLEPDPNESKPDDQGILSWALILKPGEKRELPLKFTITYPREFPVLGLE